MSVPLQIRHPCTTAPPVVVLEVRAFASLESRPGCISIATPRPSEASASPPAPQGDGYCESHFHLPRVNSSARNWRAIGSSTAFTYAVSSFSTKACATSTIGHHPHGRAHPCGAPARRSRQRSTARKSRRVRFSGQPFCQGISISGSSLAWSRTTPATTVAKKTRLPRGGICRPRPHCRSSGPRTRRRRRDPGTRDVHLVRSACTAAKPRPHPRGWPSAEPWRASSRPSGFCQSALNAQHRQRRARGIAALVEFGSTRPRPSCASVMTVMMPFASGNVRHRQNPSARGEDSIETISKWMVSPADDAAEWRSRRHRAFPLFGAVERNGDRGGDFQRAGHRDDVVRNTGRLQLGDCAFQQSHPGCRHKTAPRTITRARRNVGRVFQRCAPCVCQFRLPSRSLPHP